MNRVFGFSRNAVALVGIVAALVLVVFVGLILIGSGAVRAMMATGGKIEGISLLALLVTIIVLLVAIFVILLVLFWCCCRGSVKGKGDSIPPDALAALVPLLPLMQRAPNLLRDLGVAMYEAGKTIGWVQTNIDRAANDVASAANQLVSDITFPVLGTYLDANNNRQIDFNPANAVWVTPGAGIRDALLRLGGYLVPNPNALLPGQEAFPVHFAPNTNASAGDVAATLQAVGKALAQAASALHANPAPPAELL